MSQVSQAPLRLSAPPRTLFDSSCHIRHASLVVKVPEVLRDNFGEGGHSDEDDDL